MDIKEGDVLFLLIDGEKFAGKIAFKKGITSSNNSYTDKTHIVIEKMHKLESDDAYAVKANDGEEFTMWTVEVRSQV
jgi:hypothetical protein